MSLPEDHSDRGFVEHWRCIGPQLEAIRRQELAARGDACDFDEIDALFELGLRHAQVRTTSGLVEWQRFLMRVSRERSADSGS